MRGAKTKYDPDTFPELVEKYAMEGFSNKQIANKLRIAQSTFYLFVRDYVEFSEALTRGKESTDIRVEDAGAMIATGFEFTETHTEITYNTKGEKTGKKVKTIKKFVPPDERMIEFWLRNRRPERWRDTRDINITNDFMKLMQEATSDGEQPEGEK